MPPPIHSETSHAETVVEGRTLAGTDSIETRRAKRRAAAQHVFGMWKDRKDIPADGLDYEREMRAERMA